MSTRLVEDAARVTTPLEAPPRITLFGDLRVEIAGRDVTPGLPGRQGRALLAYLVLNPHPVHRDELAHVLWPAEAPAAPEAALSSVLAKVRRALGPNLISGGGVLTLQLGPDAEIDVRDAGEQLEHAERELADGKAASALDAAQAALAVLAQPLLPGQQGDWVDTWRAHAGELEQRALETAARAGVELGGRRLAGAERAAMALIERQPFREGGYALLMEAQAARGDVAEALRTFERLRVLLREELGARPSAALMTLHGRLLHESPPAPPPAPPGEPAIIPLPAITSTMVEGAFVGRESCVARLRSRWQESSAGQTRLVLLVGEAGVGKTRLAAQFAEEVHADGGAVLYGRADEDALLPHQPFVEALRHLLAHGGADVAGDAERERAVLGRLLPDLAPPVDPPAPSAVVDDETLRYRLFEAVAALVDRAGRRWPLLLLLDDLHWADKPTLLLLRHLLRHPQLANLLVVGTFRHVEVGPDHPLVDLLSDLRRERRYDRVTLGGLDERDTQALVADRLGQGVTPGFARRLHEQTEGNTFFIEETLARHFAGAGPARRYAVAAGRRATDLLAYEEAAEHFRRALALFEDDDEAGRCEVLLALGRVQWHAGDDQARDTFLSAADCAVRRGAAEQLARAALGLGARYWEAGYVGSRYREMLQEAVDALGSDDSPLRALLLARLAENLAFPTEHERAGALSAEALAMARRLDDADVVIAALLARHVTLLDVRHLEERRSLSEELMRLDGGHRELSAERHQWRLYDLLELGELEEAGREQLRLEALAEELRQPLFHSIAVGWRGTLAELAGDVEVAERCAEECLRHGERASTQDAVSTWAAKLLMLRRRQGRLAELLPVAERLARGGGRGTGWPSALALLHAEAGDEDIARTMYEEQLADGPDALARGMFWLTTMALLSELCAKFHDAERARALYAALSPHAHRNVVVAYSSFWGPVGGYLALLAATWGDRPLATGHVRSALVRTRAMNAPLLTADLERRHHHLLTA